MASGDKSNRISIELHRELCLHARSAWSDCSLCIDSCPGGCIKLSGKNARGHVPELDLRTCMQCGQCLSACPLEAFQAKDFTERQLLNRVERGIPIMIRCFLPYGELESLSRSATRSYQLGACIASLTSGALFELSLGRPCTLVTDRCSDCPIFRRAEPTMRRNVTDAFRMLHGIGKSGNLKETTPLFLPEITRKYSGDAVRSKAAVRSSLGSLFAKMPRDKKPVNTLAVRLKKKSVPQWRRRLKDVWLRNAYTASGVCTYAWPELVVDPSLCKACGVCMQLCPTGTIVQTLADGTFNYSFVPGTCSDCGLCIAVCPNGALSRDYNPFKQPFEQATRYEKDAVPCQRCGLPVTNPGDGSQRYCPACLAEASRTPLSQKVRRQFGVKSPSDMLCEQEDADGAKGEVSICGHLE